MEKEIKCKECGKMSKPTWHFKQSGEPVKCLCGKPQEPDICDECMKKGWLDIDTPEGQEALKNDPDLSSLLYKESPYFKK